MAISRTQKILRQRNGMASPDNPICFCDELLPTRLSPRFGGARKARFPAPRKSKKNSVASFSPSKGGISSLNRRAYRLRNLRALGSVSAVPVRLQVCRYPF